jgi:hypothetical protein
MRAKCPTEGNLFDLNTFIISEEESKLRRFSFFNFLSLSVNFSLLGQDTPFSDLFSNIPNLHTCLGIREIISNFGIKLIITDVKI